ncbi:MAG: ammonia-forming cytochrome c nitrite reductase subunit c552 [Candidatus Wallbacteria bacterium]|nr:ammonia-forming cytochrome c nitrite reductase subunit c552 [Candidatus Wallbacteria bacterium]
MKLVSQHHILLSCSLLMAFSTAPVLASQPEKPAPKTALSAAPSNSVSSAAKGPSTTAADPAAEAKFLAKMGSCAECHADNATIFQKSVHGSDGIACVDCHGGDSSVEVAEEAHAATKGFVGKPSRRDVPAFCAKCHSDAKRMANTGLPTDQYEQYKNSFHGKKVLVEGDSNAAVCTDCHGTHDILSKKNPLARTYRANIPATCDRCHGDDAKMNAYAIPTDQFKKWKQSFHGRAVLEKHDLSAAICTDCHGKHDIVNPEDAHSRVHHLSIVKTCTRCHADAELMKRHNLSAAIPADYVAGIHGIALLKRGITAAPACTNCHGNHGALPPGVKQVAMVCGRCHMRSEEFYNKSPHRQAKGFRGCIECHRNHRIAEPGSWLFSSACERCHPGDSPASARGKALAETFDRAVFTLEQAAKEVKDAAGYGFSMEKLEAVVEEGRQARVEVVPALHTLDPREADRFAEKATDILKTVQQGVQQIRIRILMRAGSLGMVLIVIMGIVFVFKLKIDRLHHEEEEEAALRAANGASAGEPPAEPAAADKTNGLS